MVSMSDISYAADLNVSFSHDELSKQLYRYIMQCEIQYDNNYNDIL